MSSQFERMLKEMTVSHWIVAFFRKYCFIRKAKETESIKLASFNIHFRA